MLGETGEQGQVSADNGVNSAKVNDQVLAQQKQDLDRLHEELASSREHEAVLQEEMHQLEGANSKAAQDLRITTEDLVVATQELVRVQGRMQELERVNRKLKGEACTNPAIHDEIHKLQDRFDELVATHGKQGVENRTLKKRVEELETHQAEIDSV